MEPEDWERLGRAFAEARVRAGLSQMEVAESLSVTRTPIQGIERGHVKYKPPTRINGTMRSYARLLHWEDGSIEAVLAGGEPTLQGAAEASALPTRISEELRDGQVLDNGVFDLAPDSEDFQMLVIVKGKKGATREEISAYMKKWRRIERELRRIGDSDDSECGANGA